MENGSTAMSSTRSVSSTVHDRTKVSSSAPTSGHASTTTSTTRQSRSHHQHHHNADSTRRPSSTAPPIGGNPNTAKDTFLNYFFGQSDGSAAPGMQATSGPVGGIGLSAAMASGVTPSGRDTTQSSAPTGLMAGKMGPDGSSAAYDMKSLGKHIEAVSN